MRTAARGVLVAALVFTTLYTAYVTVSVVTIRDWTSTISKPLAVGALALGTLTCAEMLVLGLNVSFLEDRLVPRARRRTAYIALGATALATFAVAVAGDVRFAAYLGSFVLPGAASYGILLLFSPSYVARQEERAGRRAPRPGTRSPAPQRTPTARPASKGRPRAQASARSRQRKGGRKRH
jgi:hypothetical protein